MYRKNTSIGIEIRRVQDAMERLMRSAFDDWSPLIPIRERRWRPSVDIYETAEHLVILVELAGVVKDDISIVLEDNILRISGRRVDLPPAPKVRLHQMEIDFGDFETVIKVPTSVDGEGIKASYRDGFLRIMIPKEKEIIYRIEVS
ncbi:MAG: Hsp20/alpha crystallin family protein [bacterium]